MKVVGVIIAIMGEIDSRGSIQASNSHALRTGKYPHYMEPLIIINYIQLLALRTGNKDVGNKSHIPLV